MTNFVLQSSGINQFILAYCFSWSDVRVDEIIRRKREPSSIDTSSGGNVIAQVLTGDENSAAVFLAISALIKICHINSSR